MLRARSAQVDGQRHTLFSASAARELLHVRYEMPFPSLHNQQNLSRRRSGKSRVLKEMLNVAVLSVFLYFLRLE